MAQEERIEYNFSESVKNKEAMSIINQMEYLTGMKAGNDIFAGKDNMDNAFINMYGSKLYNYIAARMNRLTSEANDVIIADYTKLEGDAYSEYFEETQDAILYTAFYKELESITKPDKKIDLEDAMKYFKRLEDFKQLRGKVVSEKNKETSDRAYDMFFSTSLGRVYREMAKYDKDAADELDGRFHYDYVAPQEVSEINQQFKTLITEDITQTEVDEISRTLNRDAKNNSKVVIENERV
jgi:hypothetical protein